MYMCIYICSFIHIYMYIYIYIYIYIHIPPLPEGTQARAFDDGASVALVQLNDYSTL